MAMLNHGSLIASSSSSQRAPGVASPPARPSISAGVRPSTNAPSTPVLDRQPREPAQLGVGPEQQHVDAGDHLRDVLVGDVGQALLAELGERQVRAVAEQQELEVVLPHQRRRSAACAGRRRARRGTLGVLVAERSPRRARTRAASGTGRSLISRDQRLHLRRASPRRARPSSRSSGRRASGSSRPARRSSRVGDGVDRDVDVAVDDRGSRCPSRAACAKARFCQRAERLVGRVDRRHVERRHRHREVHRVPEPEAVLVGSRRCSAKSA